MAISIISSSQILALGFLQFMAIQSLRPYFQGFTAVTDIAGGFSTWRENELPTTIH
jgi:rhodanese-related sulfurtransferase